VLLRSYRKSTQGIPRFSGFIWIKARNARSRAVTVWAVHSPNVYESVRLTNKSEWLKDGLTDYWIEVLLDKDIVLSA